MKNCDKKSLCYVNSHDIVALSTAIASFLTREMSNTDLRILTRLISGVLRSLEVALEIDFIQETECKEENPLAGAVADIQEDLDVIEDI